MTYDRQTWANEEVGGTPLEADRLNHMEDGIVRAHGGVLTVRIAHSTESTPEEIDAADYLCDGTADNVEFQAAIDYLEANQTGAAKLIVGQGYYMWAGVVNIGTGLTAGCAFTITSDTGFEIERDAAAGAIFDLVNDWPYLTIENASLYDWGGTANTAPLIDGNSRGTVIRQCFFENDQGRCMTRGTGLLRVEQSDFVSVGGSCFYQTGVVGTMYATDSSFYAGTSGYSIESVALLTFSNFRFDRCTFTDGGIRIDGTSGSLPRVEIADCQFKDPRGEYLYLSDIAILTMKDCRLYGTASSSVNGIHLDNVDRGIIADCSIEYARRHAIYLNNCDRVAITDNTIDGYGQETNNTYSGVFLDGDTNDCVVRGNTLRSTTANKGLYGIRVDDSTCDNNVVEDNDLRSSCNTAGNEFSDAGTGTRGWLTRELAYFAGGIAVGGTKRNRFDRAAVLGHTLLDINTAPTGATAIVDVHKNGTTIYTTQASRPAIAISGFAATSSALPDVKAIAAGDYLVPEIDQVGSTIPGSDLVVLQRYMPV